MNGEELERRAGGAEALLPAGINISKVISGKSFKEGEDICE